MRDVFARELVRLASEDDRIMFVTGDLGFGVFEDYIAKHGSQYLNVGVAEQNMVAVATGLALEGRIVFVYSIGNFPVLRCLEQIRNDAAYHDANVKVVSIGGGFSYGPLGMSHHATEDIAIMRSIPQIRSFTPGTLSDVAHSMEEMAKSSGTDYLRLDKSHGEEAPGAEDFREGAWRIMSLGSDVTLVACGGILGEAQDAAQQLKGRGLNAQVVDATQVSPIAAEEVLRCLGRSPAIVTLEEHVVRGGLAGVVAESIATTGHRARLIPVGVGSSFMSEVGSQGYLRKQTGLDASSVVRLVVDSLR